VVLPRYKAGEADATNVNNAGIALTNGEPIFESDLENWLSRRTLPTRPVVFINACQGGQLSTIFYDSLAAKFLSKPKRKVLSGSGDPGGFSFEVDSAVIFQMAAPNVGFGEQLRTLVNNGPLRGPFVVTFSLSVANAVRMP